MQKASYHFLGQFDPQTPPMRLSWYPKTNEKLNWRTTKTIKWVTNRLSADWMDESCASFFFSKILTSHSSVIFLHWWQTGTIKRKHSKWQFVLHICVGFANYTFLSCENCTSLWLAKVTCLVLIRFPLQIKILNSLPVEWLQMEVIAVNTKCDVKQKQTL